MRFLGSAILAFVLLSASATPAVAVNADWVVRKTEWSPSDEKNFGDFVTAIANSGCRSVDACFKSPANPYRASDDPRWTFTSDCGRFPYLLRTYFAWKNGLPMSVISSVASVSGDAPRGLRYTSKGNYVTRRFDIIPSASRPVNGMKAIASVMSVVNTAIYRTNLDYDNPAQNAYLDLIPVAINRDGVRPGTLIYDANGHAAIVYKVAPDGRVFFVDAHPGNLVTRSLYGAKFKRSSQRTAGGFREFRPLKLTGATRLANGTYVGGRITTVPMTQVPNFSMEQYFGNQPNPAKDFSKARFAKNGQPLVFHDWVRESLAIGDLKFNPINELQNSIDAICGDLQDRVVAVEDSINHGIQNKPQPYALPDNIYGTSGEWEEFSSPSRDARLKTSFVEIRQEIQKYVELYRQGSPRVVYGGTDLASDLRQAYEQSANACVIQYLRTDGSAVRMSYSHVALRLFALSFDPYQCVERRWGATDPAELSTCNDGSTKQMWYDAEQNLRNQIDRPYDQPMGFNLNDLRSEKPGTGPRQAPDVDLRGYLYSL